MNSPIACTACGTIHTAQNLDSKCVYGPILWAYNQNSLFKSNSPSKLTKLGYLPSPFYFSKIRFATVSPFNLYSVLNLNFKSELSELIIICIA